MLLQIVKRPICTAKCSDSHGLAGNMVEDMEGKIRELSLDCIVHDSLLTWNHRKDFVIDLSVFDLLHQANGVAVHKLAGFQNSLGHDEAVHVVSIFGRCVQDKSIRKWIGA